MKRLLLSKLQCVDCSHTQFNSVIDASDGDNIFEGTLDCGYCGPKQGKKFQNTIHPPHSFSRRPPRHISCSVILVPSLQCYLWHLRERQLRERRRDPKRSTLVQMAVPKCVSNSPDPSRLWLCLWIRRRPRLWLRFRHNCELNTTMRGTCWAAKCRRGRTRMGTGEALNLPPPRPCD